MSAKIKKCAIYTRKSHIDKSPQDFNSLEAQRECAEYYIRSMRDQGWRLIERHYDDYGYSGENLARPALKELRADILKGEIDIIVVYKIDRLSRSILDFVELLNFYIVHHVNFVSVTQSINTETSSGRMMLNVLIAFAQYEREIIADRIRDKMRAMRIKGFHVGGYGSFGYTFNEGRKLVIDPEEGIIAKNALDCFKRTGSLTRTLALLNKRKKPEAKSWTGEKVKRFLMNPLYCGYIRSGGKIFKSTMPHIITYRDWQQIQESLKDLIQRSPGRIHQKKTYHVLNGLLFCETCQGALNCRVGAKMLNGKINVMYFCPGSPCEKNRITRTEMEKYMARAFGISPQDEEMFSKTLFLIGNRFFWRKIIDKIMIGPTQISLYRVIGMEDYIRDKFAGYGIKIQMPERLTRMRRYNTKIIHRIEPSMGMPSLEAERIIRYLIMARKMYRLALKSNATSWDHIAQTLGLSLDICHAIFCLNFLAPDIVAGIINGYAPPGLSVHEIVKHVPEAWSEQRKLWRL